MVATKPTIDMDLVTRWIEALESGEYQQGKGVLRRNDTFCCLGVVCDVADPNRWQSARPLDGAMLWGKSIRHLPDELCDRLGLWMSGDIPNDSYWMLPGHKRSRFLTDLNDHDASFTEIATALREHYSLPPREVTP